MPLDFPKGVTPHTALLSIPNLVPGAEMLGYGFNIFAAYSFDSAILPLFDLGQPSDWTAPSGKVYSLPQYVTRPGGSSAGASSQAFATSSEFTSYFQGSASVAGSIGAFSGTFSSTYSQSQRDSSTYSWGLVESDFIAWQVGLDYNISRVFDEVKNDPDWKALPATFNPQDEQNVLAFYRFFQKFGTHFISRVAAGGALYYYFAVATSAKYNASQIAASASFEYNGLTAKTQAQATANWQNCAASWTTNRQSHAMTVPATTGVIRWVNPPTGSYDQDGAFAEWSTEVVQNPSRCKFMLTPIWSLFSGTQWTAIEQAFAAYGSNRVLVQASPFSNGMILVNGSPIMPPGGYPTSRNQGYWQLVVLDRDTLAVVFNKLYTFTVTPKWPDDTFTAMANDLRPYVGTGKYILVTATSVLSDGCNPTSEFYAQLKSFGSGPGMDAWMKTAHGVASGHGAAYALVGAGASVAGLEGFTAPNKLGPPWNASYLTVNALLVPSGGTFSPTPYQP